MKTRRTPSRHSAQSPWQKYVGIPMAFILAILVAFVGIVAIVIPTVTGSQTYTVLTRSMTPGIQPGTFLVVQPQQIEDLKIGDIITYQLHSGEPEVVTHRIIAIAQNTDGEIRLTTQGDANAQPDANPVRAEQIKGVVLYGIPYLGWVANFRDQSGQIWVPIAVGLLFIYAAAQVSWWGYQKVASHKRQLPKE